MRAYLLDPQIKEYNVSVSDFLRARLSVVLDSFEGTASLKIGLVE